MLKCFKENRREEFEIDLTKWDNIFKTEETEPVTDPEPELVSQ